MDERVRQRLEKERDIYGHGLAAIHSLVNPSLGIRPDMTAEQKLQEVWRIAEGAYEKMDEFRGHKKDGDAE